MYSMNKFIRRLFLGEGGGGTCKGGDRHEGRNIDMIVV